LPSRDEIGPCGNQPSFVFAAAGNPGAVIQACLVSFFRNAVQRPLPLRISELLVGDEVAEINAGVVSLDYASLNSCFHVA